MRKEIYKVSYFYVNPMSYNNLSLYDDQFLKTLIKQTECIEITYVCSILKNSNVDLKKKIINLYNYNLLKNSFFKSLSYTNSSLKLALILLKSNPEFIHFQWFKLSIIDLILLTIIKRFSKAKIILTVHNARKRNSNPFLKRIDKLIYSKIDWLIFHTKACKEFFIKENGLIPFQKYFILRHGILNYKRINFSSFKNDNKKLNNLAYNLKKYDKKYLFIGNGSHYKGIDILLDAWNLSNNKNKSGKGCLIIAGKIEHKINLKYIELLENRESNIIIFNEKLSDYFLSKIVDLCDFILLTHRYISHSGVYSSFLEYRKPFIYNSSDNNHMNTFKTFRETGFSYNKTSRNLFNLINQINLKKEDYKIDNKKWGKAIKFFSWEESFKDSKLVEAIFECIDK